MKKYYFCKTCGEFVYRLVDFRHGDGSIDSDDNPIYLLTDENDMSEEDIQSAFENEIYCGCND